MFSQLALQFYQNPQLDDDQGYQQAPSVKCPFDESHIMQPKNLLTHINRCKSPNRILYVECRYDPCHWIYPEDKTRHYEECQTRKQYYMDLDLREGDWDQEQAEKQKEYEEKRKKRKEKLVRIVKLLKKFRKEMKDQNIKEKEIGKIDGAKQKEFYDQEIDKLMISLYDKEQLKRIMSKYVQAKNKKHQQGHTQQDIFTKKPFPFNQPSKYPMNYPYNNNYLNPYTNISPQTQPQFYYPQSVQQFPHIPQTPNIPSFQSFQNQNFYHNQPILHPNIPPQFPNTQQFFINNYDINNLMTYEYPSMNCPLPVNNIPRVEPQSQLKFQATSNTQKFLKNYLNKSENTQKLNSDHQTNVQTKKTGSETYSNRNFSGPNQNSCINNIPMNQFTEFGVEKQIPYQYYPQSHQFGVQYGSQFYPQYQFPTRAMNPPFKRQMTKNPHKQQSKVKQPLPQNNLSQKDRTKHCETTQSKEKRNKHHKRRKSKDRSSSSSQSEQKPKKSKKAKKQRIQKKRKYSISSSSSQSSSQNSIQKKKAPKQTQKKYISKKQEPTFNDKPRTKTSQQSRQFTPILQKSISSYDFYPFEHQHQTINFPQIPQIHNRSDFLDMKEMLQILQKKGKKKIS